MIGCNVTSTKTVKIMKLPNLSQLYPTLIFQSDPISFPEIMICSNMPQYAPTYPLCTKIVIHSKIFVRICFSQYICEGIFVPIYLSGYIFPKIFVRICPSPPFPFFSFSFFFSTVLMTDNLGIVLIMMCGQPP